MLSSVSAAIKATHSSAVASRLEDIYGEWEEKTPTILITGACAKLLVFIAQSMLESRVIHSESYDRYLLPVSKSVLFCSDTHMYRIPGSIKSTNIALRIIVHIDTHSNTLQERTISRTLNKKL